MSILCMIYQERETNEKLRIQMRNLELRGEKNDRELMDTKTKLEIEAAKRPSSTSISSDQQGWKSAVMTRMYEEKLKGLEADNEKRVGVIWKVVCTLNKKLLFCVLGLCTYYGYI